jgi:endonuclease YncB( thermonuclease family)
LLVFVATCAFAAHTFAADGRPAVLRGQVVAVGDGDSLTLRVGNEKVKVRLAQIDAPELAQPYGRESKDALAAMVSKRMVRAEVIELDRYGRSVAEVYLNGRHINRDMVELGYAWAYTKYSRSIHVLELEDAARAAGRGLWQLPEDQRDAPWEWRHRRGNRPRVTQTDPTEFACGVKRRCREMTSCAEARFHLTECGLEIDGDRDGIPCESLCRR